MARLFPKGCYIDNIKQRGKYTYGALRAPDGQLLISATLDYICDEVSCSEVVSVEDFEQATGLTLKKDKQ